MPEFEIKFTGHVSVTADTLAQAVEKFEAMPELNDMAPVTFYECGEGISHDVLGFCEISGKPIFKGDDYSCDGEGVMWLNAAKPQEGEVTHG